MHIPQEAIHPSTKHGRLQNSISSSRSPQDDNSILLRHTPHTHNPDYMNQRQVMLSETRESLWVGFTLAKGTCKNILGGKSYDE